MSLHRYNAKRDANELEIVNFFKKYGFTVERLSSKNVPDLLLGKRGKNYLVEVKVPTEDLNPGQKIWHLTWKGQCTVVKSIEDAQNFIYNEVLTSPMDDKNGKKSKSSETQSSES